jgi:hypothetical protein
MMSQLRSTRSDSSAALYVQSPSDTYQAGLEVATPNPVLTDEEMRLLRLFHRMTLPKRIALLSFLQTLNS